MIKLRQFALLAVVLFAIPISVRAETTMDQWTYADIAHLFPEPPEGWRASSLDLNTAETITSEFEAIASTMLAPTENVSIRFIATRRYSSEGREIEIRIDTEDIEVAAQIDAVVAGYETDTVLRDKLRSAGIGVARLSGFPGISIDTGPESGRAFKIGSAGVITVECNYMDCGEDMERVLAALDFATVERFVAFDHRRGRNGETVGARQ